MTMTAVQQIAARKTYGGGDNTIPGYLEQEVLLWSPEKITLKTYDLFIVSAKRKDVRRMNRVLAELIGALNFEHGDLPQRIYRLYEYCQSCVAQRRYDEAAGIIQELRETWAKTFELE
ncbi:MAG: flagellar protein FliS [Candidatus Kapaibacterium sp.]|nr:flagellar protein FliS [Bacteroidota bacterium]